MPIIKGIKATPQNYIDSDDLVSVTVVAGNNLTIECIADGTPHPEYFWNKTLEVGATFCEDGIDANSIRKHINFLVQLRLVFEYTK